MSRVITCLGYAVVLLTLITPQTSTAQPLPGAPTYSIRLVPSSGGSTGSAGSVSLFATASSARSPLLFYGQAGVMLSGSAGTGNDRGWRMLSSPVAGATRGALADDINMTATSGSALYSFDGSKWVPVNDNATALPSGRGFMLYVFDDATEEVGVRGLGLDLPGFSPTADVTISGLAAGRQRQLLGNPFDMGFDLSSLDLVAQGFQATVQIWNPVTKSWQVKTQETGTSDVVAVWQGFFVERSKLNAGGTALKFAHAGRTAGGTLVGGKRASASPWRLDFVLQGLNASGGVLAQDQAATLYFGESSKVGWDPFDASKQSPPFSQNYVLLSFQGDRDGLPVDLAQRSHPDAWAGDAVFPMSVNSSTPFSQHRITWPSLVDLPASWDLALQDAETGVVIDLRKANDYVLDGAVGNDRLQLVVSGASGVSVDTESLPTDWKLDEAYPNPFNPETLIGYAAPEAGRVRMVVYDMLGRRMAILQDAVVAAGRHEVRFDASDLPTGVYVYMLETPAGQFSKTVVLSR